MVGDAGMAVAIDEARRHPLAAAVDLVIGGFARAGPIARHFLQADDAAIFDHDVDRADRRCAGAVDDGGAAQCKALERTNAAVARGGLCDDRDLALVADARQLIARRNFRLCLISHGAFPLLSSRSFSTYLTR